MPSQYGMQNRRKFIKRSALGAGGLLFSSVLLQSCTDHNIPDPELPIDPPDRPPLTFTVDWNDDAKTMFASAIEMIPVAGDLLGGLVDIFWPSSKVDVWGQIKSQVEALVNQKIAAQVYTDVQGNLTGLNNNITLYLNYVNEGSTAEILSQWMITRSLFVLYQPNFQSAGNELPLLPLFGQFANLYLALLRDCVAFGQSWGRTEADHQQDITDLKQAISDFYSYTANTYNNGRFALSQKIKPDSHHIEPFKTINTYDRQLSQTVLVFMDMWAYSDFTLYPTGTKVVYSREIYSDPFGSADDSGTIKIASAPTQSPTNLTVWGGDRIQSVQLTYPAGSGPGGVTTTPRMGDPNGGTTNSPLGGSFNVAPQSIMAGRATWGDIVNSMQFLFADNTSTPMMGGGGTGGLGSHDTGWVGYNDTFLSSVHINGESAFYASADLVVFGFQYWTTPTAQLNAIEALYVTSPNERSAADFANQFPNLAIPANLITDELKAARLAYWALIKERVKKPV